MQIKNEKGSRNSNSPPGVLMGLVKIYNAIIIEIILIDFTNMLSDNFKIVFMKINNNNDYETEKAKLVINGFNYILFPL